MSKPYNQLSLKERENIHFMIWDGLSIREIARRLKRNPSTISREVNRNTPPKRKQYTPHLAQEKYKNRKRVARERPRLKDPQIVKYVHEKMVNPGWSPDALDKKQYKDVRLASEGI